MISRQFGMTRFSPGLEFGCRISAGAGGREGPELPAGNLSTSRSDRTRTPGGTLLSGHTTHRGPASASQDGVWRSSSGISRLRVASVDARRPQTRAPQASFDRQGCRFFNSHMVFSAADAGPEGAAHASRLASLGSTVYSGAVGLATIAGCGYVSVCALAFVFQRRLQYFPTKEAPPPISTFPEVGPGRHCPPRHRHAFGALAY